jgi:hypothetical protein
MSDFLRRVCSELARIFVFTRRDAMAARFDEEARRKVERPPAQHCAGLQGRVPCLFLENALRINRIGRCHHPARSARKLETGLVAPQSF